MSAEPKDRIHLGGFVPCWCGGMHAKLWTEYASPAAAVQPPSETPAAACSPECLYAYGFGAHTGDCPVIVQPAAVAPPSAPPEPLKLPFQRTLTVVVDRDTGREAADRDIAAMEAGTSTSLRLTTSDLYFHQLRLRVVERPELAEKIAVFSRDDSGALHPVGLRYEDELSWPVGFLEQGWELMDTIKAARAKPASSPPETPPTPETAPTLVQIPSSGIEIMCPVCKSLLRAVADAPAETTAPTATADAHHAYRVGMVAGYEFARGNSGPLELSEMIRRADVHVHGSAVDANRAYLTGKKLHPFVSPVASSATPTPEPTPITQLAEAYRFTAERAAISEALGKLDQAQCNAEADAAEVAFMAVLAESQQEVERLTAERELFRQAVEDGELLNRSFTFTSHDLPLTMTGREWLRALSNAEASR
jgi:hypothetical protein